MEKNSKKMCNNWLNKLFGDFSYLLIGVLIALGSYGLSYLMPEVPGAITQFIGLIVFAFTMVYTILKRVVEASKNITKEYLSAKGRDSDAD